MDSRSNRFLEVLECSLFCHSANIVNFLRAVTNTISGLKSSEIEVPTYFRKSTAMEPMTAQMADVTIVWMFIGIVTALIALVAHEAKKGHL